MAIADLSNVLNIFRGSDIDEEARGELFKEALLMTLARAADADINIQTVEVKRIQELMKEHTGEDFSSADVRWAARKELYAEAGLRKHLASVRKKLSDEQRVEIVRTLADVFASDEEIGVLEVDFYNGVAEALQVAASEVPGLVAGSVPPRD